MFFYPVCGGWIFRLKTLWWVDFSDVAQFLMSPLWKGDDDIFWALWWVDFSDLVILWWVDFSLWWVDFSDEKLTYKTYMDC